MFCKKCGIDLKQLDPTEKFCPACNTPIGPACNTPTVGSYEQNSKITVVLERDPSNGFGIASLIFGIIGIFIFSPIFVPLAVLFGIIAIVKKQLVFGVVGLVCAAIGFITSPILMGWLALMSIGTLITTDAVSEKQKHPTTTYSQPQTKVRSFQSLGAKATSLRFFEGGTNMPPYSERKYETKFFKSDARSIYWELNLSHPQMGERIDFSIDVVCYRPNNTINRYTANSFLEADWTSSYHANKSCGNTLGQWLDGVYRIDINIEGQKITTGSFEILPSELPQNPRQELKDETKNQQAIQSPLAEQNVTTTPTQVAPTIPTTQTFNPSFDCAKASTDSEHLICTNPNLAAADVEMAKIYRQVINNTTDKKSLMREQNQWRKNQRDACKDIACMLRAYKDHTNQLSRKLDQIATAKTAFGDRDKKIAEYKKAFSGKWKGTYLCGQGITGLTLDISTTQQNMSAVFNFYPVQQNPNVGSGSFSLSGEFSTDGFFKLKPNVWINQPQGYGMVGMSGKISDDRKELIGSIDSGCSNFHLYK